MAIVRHFSVSWTSSGTGHDMAPGEVHHYTFSDFDEKEAVSVSMHPVVRFLPRSVLVVENVQGVTGAPVFRALKFSVRNAGPNYIPGYGVGFGIIFP